VVGCALWPAGDRAVARLIFGGSLHTADLGSVLIKQLGSIALAVVVINLWEETVWAGFFQPAMIRYQRSQC
jgi:membrane protease YdiL (CAAX protease family)